MEENNNMQGEFDGKSHNYNNVNRKNTYPPGYRFNPSDIQLVVDYLKNKVMNRPLPLVDRIHEFDVYKCHPRMLSGKFEKADEKFMYFFTPRARRCPKGVRPSRRAGNHGFWKAAGADTCVGNVEHPDGYKTVLVFYEGTSKESTKTNWIMHEYRLHKSGASSSIGAVGDERKFDDWVLCRIYENVKGKAEQQNEINPAADDNPESSATQQLNQSSPLCNNRSHPPSTESANFIRQPSNNIGPNNGCHFGCCIQEQSVPSCSATQFDDNNDLLDNEFALNHFADSFLNLTGYDPQQHDVPKPAA